MFPAITQKIHQNSKKWGFCEELLSENDFKAALVNFCCYEYIIVPSNASEAVQKRRLAQAKDTAGIMPTH